VVELSPFGEDKSAGVPDGLGRISPPSPLRGGGGRRNPTQPVRDAATAPHIDGTRGGTYPKPTPPPPTAGRRVDP
jgi:hypothetical protein